VVISTRRGAKWHVKISNCQCRLQSRLAPLFGRFRCAVAFDPVVDAVACCPLRLGNEHSRAFALWEKGRDAVPSHFIFHRRHRDDDDDDIGGVRSPAYTNSFMPRPAAASGAAARSDPVRSGTPAGAGRCPRKGPARLVLGANHASRSPRTGRGGAVSPRTAATRPSPRARAVEAATGVMTGANAGLEPRGFGRCEAREKHSTLFQLQSLVQQCPVPKFGIKEPYRRRFRNGARRRLARIWPRTPRSRAAAQNARAPVFSAESPRCVTAGAARAGVRSASPLPDQASAILRHAVTREDRFASPWQDRISTAAWA
jgi:hypothetical protein